MTAMPRTTVTDVLACFEDEFTDFAEGFCRGEYLMWLGSGISRGVVPGVPMLLQKMLEFLRANIDEADPTCRFRKAFDEVLEGRGRACSDSCRSGPRLSGRRMERSRRHRQLSRESVLRCVERSGSR